jgi:hypothetical protein
MTCSDVRNLLPDLALGDLDVELARQAADHLRSCADCRAGEAALGRAVAALRLPLPVAPSTGRRDAAVARMVRAHGEVAERILVRRGVPWIPAAAAAAFLVAVVAALFLRPGSASFQVGELRGSADLLDRRIGAWHPLAVGERIHTGDRIVTHKESMVRLDAEDGTLHVDQESSVDVVGARRVTLDHGRLCVMLTRSGAAPIRVTDIANNVVTVREGRVEASLREVRVSLGGSSEQQGRPAILPAARTEVSRRLVVRVTSGGVDLEGSQDQRIRVDAGQEGTFDFGGKPAAGTWIDTTRGGNP